MASSSGRRNIFGHLNFPADPFLGPSSSGSKNLLSTNHSASAVLEENTHSPGR